MPKNWGIKKIIDSLFGKEEAACAGHDCSKVAKNVFLALDGELSPEEEKTLLADVEKCPRCLEYFNIEKAFKQFLKERIARKTIDKGLVSSIKEQINNIQAQ